LEYPLYRLLEFKETVVTPLSHPPSPPPRRADGGNIRIYALEKKVNQAQSKPGADAERVALLAEEEADTDAIFSKALDAELEKICTFYVKKERELLAEVQQLLKDFQEYQDHGFQPTTTAAAAEPRDYEGDEDSDSDEETPAAGSERLLRPVRSRRSTMHQSTTSEDFTLRRRYSTTDAEEREEFYDKRITLKKRAISLFVALRELKSYVQLNKTGFTKALKKYDKILNRNLKQRYLEQKVVTAYPFQHDTLRKLDENVKLVEEVYAELVTNGDLEEAKKELRLHLREHVVWERNTVWRDMIGVERRAYGAHIGLTGGPLLGDEVEGKRLAGDEAVAVTVTKELRTPCGTIHIPLWLFSPGFFILTFTIILFAVLLQIKIFDTPEQNNCFAMLVFVSLLWATEVCYPLFANVTKVLMHSKGHPSVRHLPPHPLPRHITPHSPLRRQTTPSNGHQIRDQIHLLSDVDAGDNASTGRLRDRGSTQ
jgi:phosphate transporter